MNIILIGYMGSGKTTVGKILANTLNYNFIDIDLEIEKSYHYKISDIFRIYGEKYFRILENKILTMIKENFYKKYVISTGGGLPIFSYNINILKALGTIFYLKIKKRTFLERTKNDRERPLKSKVNLFSKRLIHYEKVKDFVINCDYKTPEEIAFQIKQVYENNCR